MTDWSVTIDDLVQIFQQALVTLVPSFDRARIGWRSDENYDDFDRIAGALYDSIIRDSLAFAHGLEDSIPLAPYAMRQTGTPRSRILINDPEKRLGFFQLATRVRPFDTVVSIEVNADGIEAHADGIEVSTDGVDVARWNETPFDATKFAYEARFGGGISRILHDLRVKL